MYGPKYTGKFNLWICVNYPDCDAYVGVHENSLNSKPKGTLANKTLRELRKDVHAVLDPLWKSGSMKRSEVYALLSKLLEIPPDTCHVGFFNETTCHLALSRLAQSSELAERK